MDEGLRSMGKCRPMMTFSFLKFPVFARVSKERAWRGALQKTLGVRLLRVRLLAALSRLNLWPENRQGPRWRAIQDAVGTEFLNVASDPCLVQTAFLWSLATVDTRKSMVAWAGTRGWGDRIEWMLGCLACGRTRAFHRMLAAEYALVGRHDDVAVSLAHAAEHPEVIEKLLQVAIAARREAAVAALVPLLTPVNDILMLASLAATTGLPAIVAPFARRMSRAERLLVMHRSVALGAWAETDIFMPYTDAAMRQSVRDEVFRRASSLAVAQEHLRALPALRAALSAEILETDLPAGDARPGTVCRL